jgi:hypothetical protein
MGDRRWFILDVADTYAGTEHATIGMRSTLRSIAGAQPHYFMTYSLWI